MGHPNRAKLREKKKKASDESLTRKNHISVIDLTPHNAVGMMRSKRYGVKLK
jgi:hypothetical protein